MIDLFGNTGETYGTQGMKVALNDLWTGSILPACKASILKPVTTWSRTSSATKARH